MSEENVEAARQAGVLVSYRVFGGTTGVDHRLTVFENGAVELDERHRSRDSIWIQMSPSELEGLRSALSELPPDLWSRPTRLGLARIGDGFRGLLGFLNPFDMDIDSEMDFRIRWGKRVIFGREVLDPELVKVMGPLDAVRIRTVRSVPR
jgi:hypothetical protein